MTAAAPRLLTLIAELGYACPLRCAYCSNPVQLKQRATALSSADWRRVIGEAEQLGALHVHFTGGEPLLRGDLEELVRHARSRELYTNLITSGIPLSRERLVALQQAGLEHLQLSFQAASPEGSRSIAGTDATAQKLRVAHWVKELGIPLTINMVLHRENLAELEAMLGLAESLEPYRIELANAQYLGWALLNRDRLLPSAAQLERARELASAARERLRGKTDVLFVLPDYYADRPRACMQGWAESYLVVTPDGLLLPCQAARDLPGVHFDNASSAPLAELWARSPALNRFRGRAWQPELCRSCPESEKDLGGCRCQAFQLTGDASAADPACSLTPAHHLVRAARDRSTLQTDAPPLQLRRMPRFVD
jgi:pyrroloquinoline quinone biosynthesis protein E